MENARRFSFTSCPSFYVQSKPGRSSGSADQQVDMSMAMSLLQPAGVSSRSPLGTLLWIFSKDRLV